jgi:hypothetical protein
MYDPDTVKANLFCCPSHLSLTPSPYRFVPWCVLSYISELSCRGNTLKNVLAHYLRSCHDKLHFQELGQQASNCTIMAEARGAVRCTKRSPIPSSSLEDSDTEFINHIWNWQVYPRRDLETPPKRRQTKRYGGQVQDHPSANEVSWME